MEIANKGTRIIMAKKINMGSGKDYKKGWINIDNFEKADMNIDLNKELPFKENEIDEIIANDLIEHLDNPIQFLNECHRILRIGGIIHIQVPHYKDPSAYIPQHKTYFSTRWFEEGINGKYNGLKEYKITKMKLGFTQRENKFIEIIPNLFPKLWERFLPVIGIRVTLKKVKVND